MRFCWRRAAPPGRARFGAFAVFGLAALLAVVGCKKEREEQTVERKVTFSEAEEKRGRKACGSYVERVCRCEEEGKDVPESCGLAKSRTEALDIAVRAALSDNDKEPKDQWALDQNARRIIEKCVKADLELDPQLCPR